MAARVLWWTLTVSAAALASNDTVTFLKIPNAKIQRPAFDALMNALGKCPSIIDFRIKAIASAKIDGAALTLAHALQATSTLTNLHVSSSIGNKHIDVLAQALAEKKHLLVEWDPDIHASM